VVLPYIIYHCLHAVIVVLLGRASFWEAVATLWQCCEWYWRYSQWNGLGTPVYCIERVD